MAEGCAPPGRLIAPRLRHRGPGVAGHLPRPLARSTQGRVCPLPTAFLSNRGFARFRAELSSPIAGSRQKPFRETLTNEDRSCLNLRPLAPARAMGVQPRVIGF